MINETGRSFVFYPSWLQFIEKLGSYEDKYKMVKTILEYGCYGHYEEIDDKMIQNTFDNLIKPLIDNAQDKYNSNVEFGKTKGRARVVTEDAIRDCLDKKMTGKQIADFLGVTTSAVYKSDAWKNRKGNRNENPSQEPMMSPQDETPQGFEEGFIF